MAVDTRAVVGRTNWYVDGKPALEIHIPKSQASHLPIKEDGSVEIELKIGEHLWNGRFRRTAKCNYVWISPTLRAINGKKCRLVDALGNCQPNDRVILRVDGRKVEVLLAEGAESEPADKFSWQEGDIEILKPGERKPLLSEEELDRIIKKNHKTQADDKHFEAQRMTEVNFKQGLECYDPEKQKFPELAYKEGLTLCKRDVLLILKWKLGRIKGSNCRTVSDDNMEKINRIVRDARIIDRMTTALNALSKIHGIGLAAATAILTVCCPKDFTILDWRVLDQLGLSPSDTAKWTAERYLDTYLPRVRECAERWGCSLRDADRALWGLSVQKRIDTVIVQSQRTLRG